MRKKITKLGVRQRKAIKEYKNLRASRVCKRKVSENTTPRWIFILAFLAFFAMTKTAIAPPLPVVHSENSLMGSALGGLESVLNHTIQIVTVLIIGVAIIATLFKMLNIKGIYFRYKSFIFRIW